MNIDQATQLDCGKALVLLCEEKIYILVMLIAPTGTDWYYGKRNLGDVGVSQQDIPISFLVKMFTNIYIQGIFKFKEDYDVTIEWIAISN